MPRSSSTTPTTKKKNPTSSDAVLCIDEDDSLMGSSSDEEEEEEEEDELLVLPSIEDKKKKEKTPVQKKSKKPQVIISKAKDDGEEEDEEEAEPENDSFDVILPPLLGSGNAGECTIMIEVNSEDAALLDYEGISGAIGRFEADDRGVVLDLKGCQYQGSLLPGPTALVVGMSKGSNQLRVESITDEYATLVQTQDIMAKLDAVVSGAAMDDGFLVQEENVNRASSNKKTNAGGGGDGVDNSNSKVKVKTPTSTKRGAPSTPSSSKPPVAKKRKLSAKKTPQTKSW